MFKIINILIFFSLLYRLGFSNRKPNHLEWAIVYFSLLMITTENVGAGVLCLIVVCLMKERSDALKYYDAMESFKNPSVLTSSFRDVKQELENLKKKYNFTVDKNKLKEYFKVNGKQNKFNETLEKLKEDVINVKNYYENLGKTPK